MQALKEKYGEACEDWRESKRSILLSPNDKWNPETIKS